MSIARTIGYLGIALLALIATLGLLSAIAGGDWYGVAAMLCFAVLLAFLAKVLRAAGERESSSGSKSGSELGWYGESLSALFRGPVLHTPEGLIVLLGSLASASFGLLSFFAPAWVGLSSGSGGEAVLFGMWPVVLFVIHVHFCGPSFRPGAFSSLVVLCAAVFPFYLAYR